MSSESELWKRSLFGSASDGYGHCCPPVFDPSTLLALLVGIALATFFLRLVIINQVFNGRRSLSSFSIYENLGLTFDQNWMSNLLEQLLEETQENEDKDKSDIKLSQMTAEVKQNQSSSMPEDCRLEVWQCMSGVLETGVRYVETPSDMFSGLQSVLYKAVFHGGARSMWSSVMEIPQMRRMGGCISDHDSCVEHSILLRESAHRDITF